MSPELPAPHGDSEIARRFICLTQKILVTKRASSNMYKANYTHLTYYLTLYTSKAMLFDVKLYRQGSQLFQMRSGQGPYIPREMLAFDFVSFCISVASPLSLHSHMHMQHAQGKSVRVPASRVLKRASPLCPS